MDTPKALARPSAFRMNRLSDRLTFLYLDLCRIEQDDNGTHARVDTSEGTRTTYLPTATLACLLLGPGTSITAPAAAALSRTGCTIVFTGVGGVRCYSVWSPLSSSTALLTAQAKASTDPDQRISVASAMFRMRFPGGLIPDGADLAKLRGLEGARMRAVYQSEARRRHLSGWRRKHDGGDPVNLALNYANTALSGLCQAVICGLGMSPGLGFVHEGNPRSFVLDVADLYKTEVTIPAAFAQVKSVDPGRDVMRRLRDDLRLLRLLPRIVDDIYQLFNSSEDGLESGDEWDTAPLYLWNEDGSLIESGMNQEVRT